MVKTTILQSLFKENKEILTYQELKSIGLTKYYIRKLIEDGVIKRIKRGKYIHNESEEDEYFLVQQLISSSILCLLSAAAIYNLTTHIPNKYHIAVKGNYSPKLPKHPPIKIYYWRKKQYELGITSMQINDTCIKVYDKEKTVCDFLKFRKKLDYNIVKEVIKSYLKEEDKDLIKLKKYSKELNIESILSNYLEILL